MSADIIFGDDVDQMWSVRSWYFQEVLRRASKHCTSPAAIEVLRRQEPVGFLIIQAVEDVLLRKELCNALAAAGRDLLAELSPAKPRAAEEAEGLQVMIALSERCAANAGLSVPPND